MEQINVTGDWVRGLATAVELADESSDADVFMIAVSAFREKIGVEPSLVIGMGYDDALEAIISSIWSQNDTRPEGCKIVLVSEDIEVLAQRALASGS